MSKKYKGPINKNAKKDFTEAQFNALAEYIGFYDEIIDGIVPDYDPQKYQVIRDFKCSFCWLMQCREKEPGNYNLTLIPESACHVCPLSVEGEHYSCKDSIFYIEVGYGVDEAHPVSKFKMRRQEIVDALEHNSHVTIYYPKPKE